MLWTSILPSFLASIVESVETLTIVLAIGLTINWKSSLLGASAAILSLITLTFLISSILLFVPIGILRLVIGITLIIFGLQWLKKAVLRYSDLKDKHNESIIYKKKILEIKSNEIPISNNFNNFGFYTSFKSVLFKGLEVTFIIITLGVTSINNKHNLIWASGISAILAFIIILILGLLINHPLTKVPENTLKYIVGITLVSCGTYLTGQELGVTWVFHNYSLLVLITSFLVLSFVIIQWLKTYNIKKADEEQGLEDK